jgi:predicted amidohydrolase YtcJ
MQIPTLTGSLVDPAELELHRGTVVTMDPSRPRAQAIAAREGRIVAVGSDRQLEVYIGPKTRTIDLAGRLAIPGFIEGHAHLTGVGRAKMALNLRDARNWDEIVARVAEATRKTPAGEWILGVGWHQEHWDRPPTPNLNGYPIHHQLSKASPEHPVVLTHRTGHMSFANALAMKRAGITRATTDPSGGQILRDSEGEPIGVLRESAQDTLHSAHSADLRRRSSAERRAHAIREIERAVQECLRLGVTTFHDAGCSFETIELLKQLADEAKLPVRLWVMVNEENAQLLRRLGKYRLVGHANHHLTLGGIKRMIDGALGSHGAWLLEPYDDLPSSIGLQVQSIAQIEETARIALEHKLQLCVHAIGDRANREVLDVFERVMAPLGPDADLRWRIEHAQHLNPADIPRFAKLGVIASMQAVHATSDAPFVISRLGLRRAQEGAYVWQSLLKTGARVINGTDAPVEDLDPIACYYASVTRRLPSGAVFFPEQRMSGEQALRSYTIDAAYAAFEDHLKGSLTAGKLADIVVLSGDILSLPEDKLLDVRVDMTIVGGQVRFERR